MKGSLKIFAVIMVILLLATGYVTAQKSISQSSPEARYSQAIKNHIPVVITISSGT